MSELLRDYFLVNSKVNNFANTYAMLWWAIYIAHASDRFLCKQSVCFVRLNFQSLVRDVEFWPSELLKMNILSKQTFWSLLPHTKQNVIHEYVNFFSLLSGNYRKKWISRSFVIGGYSYPCPGFDVKVNLNIIWCLYFLLQIVWETLYSLNGLYVRRKHISCYLFDGHWNKSMGNILQSFRFCIRKSKA